MGVYDRDYMRDEPDFRPTRATPSSPTILLLVALGVVFLFQLLLPGAAGQALERNFALSLDGIRHGRVWQLLTFQFLHGGILHVLLNGLGLYFLGRFMEQTLGTGRYLALYFLSGTLGGLLQVAAAFIPGRMDIPVVGASAGLMGLLGAFAALYPHRMITVLVVVFPVTLRARTLFWVLTGLAVLGTLVPFGGMAHTAHLGGILAGVGFIRWGRRREQRSTSRFADLAEPPVIQSSPQPPMDDTDFITREVDPILDKIAKQGIHSLTARERKLLEEARRRMARK